MKNLDFLWIDGYRRFVYFIFVGKKNGLGKNGFKKEKK